MATDGAGFSVAWSISVRSRSYIRPDPQVPDVRVLENLKANYGKRGAMIRLRWHKGAYQPVTSSKLEDERDERVFLEILDRYTRQGIVANNSKSGHYAPKMFADEPEAQTAGVTNAALERAMRLLICVKIICLETFADNGRSRKRLVRGTRDLPQPQSKEESLSEE